VLRVAVHKMAPYRKFDGQTTLYWERIALTEPDEGALTVFVAEWLEGR
jgi:hypothetical protein